MSSAAQPVIDAHHHFWDPDNATYPWMTGPYEPLRRKYAPGDLAPELEACGVDATIVVQSRHDLGETRQLLSIAAGTPWIEGVVGWVDLTDPDVSSTITSMREEAAGSYLVGIRHLVHDEPDEEWLLRPDVTIGLQAVEDAGLTFDLLVRSREIPSAVQVARRFPGLRFILDHLGKPLVSTGDLEPWTSLVSGFRELDNVSCKVSGLVTEAVWTSWEQSDLAPYVRTALDVFGSDRLMFGSDWPVCLMAGTYLEVYEAAVTTLRDLLGNDLESVLGGCAARVYFKG